MTASGFYDHVNMLRPKNTRRSFFLIQDARKVGELLEQVHVLKQEPAEKEMLLE